MAEKETKKGLYARIFGTVQGVGFRYSTVNKARQIGLTGYARNMDDGSVEVVAHGEEEKLKKLLAWLKQGPPGSRVVRVDSHFTPYEDYYKHFGVEY